MWVALWSGVGSLHRVSGGAGLLGGYASDGGRRFWLGGSGRRIRGDVVAVGQSVDILAVDGICAAPPPVALGLHLLG